MGKKKQSRFTIQLNKKQRKILLKFGIPIIIGIVGINIGVITTRYIESRQTPINIVWAADSSVIIPKDLKKFLLTKSECGEYKGKNSPDGVGLWGVYQVSKNRFAKVAYGCSWNLSSYIMAVKYMDEWLLIPPNEYFAEFKDSNSTGALPRCKIIEKYSVDNTIEPFCINDDGSALANTVN